MTWIALFLIAFLCGSLPFSVWLGKLFLGLDVRRVGDGNPGATNVFKSPPSLGMSSAHSWDSAAARRLPPRWACGSG
jgi:glycerol-3-phosphate acyltransferase PlsY